VLKPRGRGAQAKRFTGNSAQTAVTRVTLRPSARRWYASTVAQNQGLTLTHKSGAKCPAKRQLWVEPGYPGQATGRPPLRVASGCVSRPLRPSDVGLLGESQSVVHLNTEISHRAFQLGVAQQKLDSTKIAGPPTHMQRCGPVRQSRRIPDGRILGLLPIIAFLGSGWARKKRTT
jgi:hypothetical protein